MDVVVVKAYFKEKNAASIHEIWPNLEVYFHGGVSFTPYKEQFVDLFGNKKVNFMQLYNASEGFGIQDQLKSDEMLLMLDYGIFYEFLDIKEIGTTNSHKK